MSFLYPEYLALIIPLVIYLLQNRFKLKIRIHLIILVFVLFSLSRPVVDKYEQNSALKGRDIVIALDISHSMQADDVKPNRYEFAKSCIKELLTKNPNDNIMLMVFTTNQLLLSPPTTDHQLIFTALDSLDLDYILTKGTSLKSLFLKLISMDITDKNLILITDGGDEVDADGLVKILDGQVKTLSILALGDASGSTIKNADNTLLKDADGNLVISRINPLLQELATKLDANYVEASKSVLESVEILDKKLQKSDELFYKKEHNYFELYQVPLFIAMVLFFMLHTKWAKYLLIAFAFLSVNIEASSEVTLESKILEANRYYKQKDYEKALKIYISIKTTSPTIKQALYYNTANCFTMLGNYNDAKVFYAKSLQLFDDEDAKFNLKQIALKQNQKPKDDGKTLQSSKQNSSAKGDFEKDNKKQNNKSKVQDAKQKYKISSKTYELINKGYIYENKPW